jgi:hypothetical protein
MSDDTYKTGGWGWPALSKRAHFFDPSEAQSICRKWLYTGERTPDNGKKGPDDCADCAKRLEKRRAKVAKEQSA